MMVRSLKKDLLSATLAALFVGGAFVFPVSPAIASSTDGTIDPANRYAWSENAGWIDFGTTQGNVHVTDSALSGYAWGENIGWISLNCSNDNSCSTVSYKVTNDTVGNLSGYAWSENAGWIYFGSPYGGTSIGPSGEFLGYAWGENIGWIVFNCSATGSCSAVDFRVKTDWRRQTQGGLSPESFSSQSGSGSSSSGSAMVAPQQSIPVPQQTQEATPVVPAPTVSAPKSGPAQSEEPKTKPSLPAAPTSADLQRLIAQIIEKIRALQAELAQTQASPVGGIPQGFSFQRVLKQGEQSDEVKYLQIILKREIGAPVYPEDAPTSGYFGSVTRQALIAFQEKYAKEVLIPFGLKKGTGYMGAATRTKLNNLLGA